MQSSENDPTHDELEALFVNNDKIGEIAAYLGRFNPIRIMRMQDMEIRHTTILAWLMDPKESHGLGDKFLKAVLGEAFRGRSEKGPPTALDISRSDLRNASIRREWRKMDIFVLDSDSGWAFVIENKYYSRQRKGQLAEYASTVKQVFDPKGGHIVVRGVFLTLLDEEPEDKSYAPLRYSEICSIINRMIYSDGQTLPNEIHDFLQHYLEVIQDATGMNERRNEMEKLAKELYRTHRKVLDFVMEHGASTDFVIASEMVFGEAHRSGDQLDVGEERFVYHNHTNQIFSFLPAGWVDGLQIGEQGWSGCQGWWAGYPLICWFRLVDGKDGKKGSLMLYAEVGPMIDFELRKRLIECIRQTAKNDQLSNLRFSHGAADEGKQYSRFLKSNSSAIEDVHDAQEIANEMRALLLKFKPHFNSISAALPDFTALARDQQRTA